MRGPTDEDYCLVTDEPALCRPPRTSPAPLNCPEIAEVAPHFDGPECGALVPVLSQKRYWAIPIELTLAPEMAAQVTSVTVFYTIDCELAFANVSLPISNARVQGHFGCESIENFDPEAIRYFISGYNDNGVQVCGHGSQEAPLLVPMRDDVSVSKGSSEASQPPNCDPCRPWANDCYACSCWLPCGEAKARGLKPESIWDEQPQEPRCYTGSE